MAFAAHLYSFLATRLAHLLSLETLCTEVDIVSAVLELLGHLLAVLVQRILNQVLVVGGDPFLEALDI